MNFMCWDKFELHLKPFPHTLQIYGVSPVWTLAWYDTVDSILNLKLANVGLIACVNFQVDWQTCFLYESFSTGFANVWFLTCVNLYVVCQFTTLSEGFPTFYRCRASHQYGFSNGLSFFYKAFTTNVANKQFHTYSMWILMCCDKSFLLLKAFPHVVQIQGFLPVWTLMWLDKLALSLKSLPHVLHTYDFSSKWTFMCTDSWHVCLKAFSRVHIYGFSLVCIAVCCDSSLPFLKAFPRHTNKWLPYVDFQMSLQFWHVLKIFPTCSTFKNLFTHVCFTIRVYAWMMACIFNQTWNCILI